MSKAIIDLGQVMPIKGQDYYTEAEINEFVGDIANIIETSVNTTYESTNNKVLEVSGSSTDDEYPSAKVVNNESKKLDNRINIVNRNCQAFKTCMPNETAEGIAINLQGCNDIPLNSFEIKGVSDGTVTGDNTVKVYGGNLLNEDYLKSATYMSSTYKYTQIDLPKDTTLYFKAYLKQGKTDISGLTVAFSTVDSNPNLGTSVYPILSGTIRAEANKSFSNNIYFSFYPTSVNVADIFDTYNFEVSIVSNAPYEKYQGEKSQLLSLGEIELQENDTIHKDNFDWKINDEKITDSTLLGQLKQLEKISLFEGTNNIFTVTENTSPILKVNANKKSIFNTIEARLTLLE